MSAISGNLTANLQEIQDRLQDLQRRLELLRGYL